MSLYLRYQDGGSGVRLDNQEDPSMGCALDLGTGGGGLEGPFTLWVRDRGRREATVEGLTPEDLAGLRDGISSMLAFHGYEEVIEVNVPRGMTS